MKLKSIRKDLLFTPEFNNNKSLKNNEQVKIHIKNFPTVAESKGYKSYKHTEGGGIEVVYPNDVSMLLRHVGKVENLDIEDCDEKITDGSSLSKTRVLELGPLFTEIRDYLLEASEPVDQGESSASE